MAGPVGPHDKFCLFSSRLVVPPCHLLAHLRLHPAAWSPYAWSPERWANRATIRHHRFERRQYLVPPEEREARDAAVAANAAEREAAIAAAGALGSDGLSRERGAVPCDRCGRRYLTHSDMYKHQGAAEDKPYACDGEARRVRNPFRKPKSATKTGGGSTRRRRSNSSSGGGSSGTGSTDAAAQM